MPLPYGNIVGQGIKYIKINRYDSEGIDRSDYLGQLNQLIINYDDLGPIDYNIVTTQEQNDYFVYGIQTTNQSTSSIHYEILNYGFSASYEGLITASNDSIPVNLINFSESYDYLNYFNSQSGVYTYQNTPNVDIEATCSFKARVNTGVVGIEEAYLNIKLFGPTHGVFGKTLGSIALDGITTSYTAFTSSFIINSVITDSIIGTFNDHIIENDYIQIFIENSTTSPGVITVSDFNIFFTQSQTPNPATSSLTIFNPEFINWDYNDYNALYGNAETSQLSGIFMDVDYDTNYDKPINFDLIISGTADKADIQDSNYKSQAWNNIRYNGSRYNSYKENTNKFPSNQILDGDFNDLSIDGSGYGKKPAVEQNQTYFVYFDGVGGTGPEIIDQTAYFIKYIIDSQGNVVDPDPSNISLLNLKNNFESNHKAIVQASPNVNTNLIGGPFNITNIGRISPILISETGSNINNYENTLYFRSIETNNIINTPDYVFKAAKSSGQTISISAPETQISADSVINDNSRYNSGTSKYTFLSSNDSTSITNNRVKFIAKGKIIVNFNPSAPLGSAVNIEVRIIKNNTDKIGYQYIVFNRNSNSNLSVTSNFEFDTGFQNFNNSDEIKLTVDSLDNSYGINMIILSEDFSFSSVSEYPSNNASASANYWTIGEYLTGNEVSVLTSSIELNSWYGPEYIQSGSTSIYSFGFSKIDLPFVIKPGDYIRFEYNKNKVFNITKVETTDKLYLTVVPPVPTGSMLDHFVIYRIINDGTYVILDVPKNQNVSFGGFLLPQYASSDVINNLDKITADLTQKGLIS